MTGIEKMDLVVIGKSKQPRAFRKANTKQMKFCTSTIRLGGKTGQRLLSGSGIRCQDAREASASLLDNASCHFGAAECYNAKLAFLPPNMTAHLQPLDAGKFE